MTKARLFLAMTWFCVALAPELPAQERPALKIEAPDGLLDYNLETGEATSTNGVLVWYGEAVLTADRVTVNKQTGDVEAYGRVRIQQDSQVWVGEHIRYNFYTHNMETEQFRTGKAPMYVGGENLHGDITNKVYTGRSAFVTTDDVANPGQRVRVRSIKIVPNKYVEARDAVFYLGKVPFFYFPYYRHRLDTSGNQLSFIPGYRTSYGPFLLSTYSWVLNEQLDGALHLDYRQKRGWGGGADANLHLKRWGEMSLQYYYLYDLDPDANSPGYDLPNQRHNFMLGYNATPFTNLNVKSQIRYQSDDRVLHDYFEGEYRENPQPSTFVEATKLWPDVSLDVYVQPQVNDFLTTVERLPDVRLTAFRQSVGPLPVYYESVTSAGYYDYRYAITNNVVTGDDFSGERADTFHQFTLPLTFFGWLNVIPRVGGRFTYYGNATATNVTSDEIYRGVFNTGAEVSFKVSRVWPGLTNRALALDGLRHIIQPSANYAYVPTPNWLPSELPPFDVIMPSLRLLPNDFPDYNAVDQINAANLIRVGLMNRLQTKRKGQVENFLYWNVYADLFLDSSLTDSLSSDIYSDLVFRPRPWLILESAVRYDPGDNDWPLAFNSVTLKPNDVWSWSIGHWYTATDNSPTPTAIGPGNNYINNLLFFRLNENWALRAAQNYNVLDGTLQEQSYTIYRDMRSWTAALTVRWRDNQDEEEDFTIAFAFSLKAAPKYHVGGDTVRASQLLGY